MKGRILLAAALCAAVAALCGMAEAAWTIDESPWWPLYASHLAQAALLYGACLAPVGVAWAVLSRCLPERRFIGTTLAVGALSMVWVYGLSFLLATVLARLAQLPVLLGVAAWTLACLGAPVWLLRRGGVPSVEASPGARKNAWRFAIGVALLALLTLVPSWRWKSGQRGQGTQTGPGATRPNVIVIVMDTTRLDALSCYGNARETTPNLDRLASQGVLFEQATVTAPWTLPSHASLFTGLYPSQHGADASRPRLADDLTSLPEVFRRAGYQTAGFSNNPWIGPNTNFHQGFDLFEGMWPGFDHRDRVTLWRAISALNRLARDGTPASQAESTNRRIAWWLDQARSARAPFFLFVNYIDPHFPYNPPEPYRSRFLRSENRDAAAKLNVRVLKRIPPPMRLDAGLLAALRDLYEGEVAFLDAVLGELLQDLGRRGLTDDTIVLVTSDHGENLGDHDLLFHQFSVHEALLRVPLVLHHPKGLPPGRVSTPVSIADVYPTLLRLAGLEASERADLPGRDLVNRPAAPASDRSILAEYRAPLASLPKFRPEPGQTLDESYFKRDLKSLRRGGLKLVWASDGRHELYDLSTDPWETRNLIAERAEAARAMEGDLSRLAAMFKPATGAPADGSSLDENTRRELRALGYLQ
jgi:arylsulfatase A-like enzyme